jgi:RNA polymerase sigma-70 factor (family 1)
MQYQLPTNLIYDIAIDNCEQAYKELFKILFPRLKRFSYCILKSDELAEEIASDVMISLWRNRSGLTDIKNVTVYSYVLAKNASLNMLKKTSSVNFTSLDEVDVAVLLDSTTPEQILINSELKQKLNKAINALPPKCKMVFKLVREDGLSYKEVAQILSVSPKTVDAHLVSAIRKLAESIKIEYNLA